HTSAATAAPQPAPKKVAALPMALLEVPRLHHRELRWIDVFAKRRRHLRGRERHHLALELLAPLESAPEIKVSGPRTGERRVLRARLCPRGKDPGLGARHLGFREAVL